MIAFLGKPEVKTKYLERVRLHAKMDEIIQGTYWENGRGCGVGCTIHSSDHSKYETELGIPWQIARLEDSIFEALVPKEAKLFPEQFLSSIKTGTDLSKVFPQFIIWLLTDPKDGVIKFAFEDGKNAIKNIADLYQRRLDGDEPKQNEWTAGAAGAARAAGAAGAAEAAEAAGAAGRE